MALDKNQSTADQGKDKQEQEQSRALIEFLKLPPTQKRKALTENQAARYKEIHEILLGLKDLWEPRVGKNVDQFLEDYALFLAHEGCRGPNEGSDGYSRNDRSFDPGDPGKEGELKMYPREVVDIFLNRYPDLDQFWGRPRLPSNKQPRPKRKKGAEVEVLKPASAISETQKKVKERVEKVDTPTNAAETVNKITADQRQKMTDLAWMGT